MSETREDVTAPAALDPEDAKLVVLARAARSRTGASEGAAVRDSDGRSYAATTVTLPSLNLSALQGAVAAAVSSGVSRLEAAAVVSASAEIDADGVRAVRDVSASAVVFLADLDGQLRGIDQDGVVGSASVAGTAADATTSKQS